MSASVPPAALTSDQERHIAQLSRRVQALEARRAETIVAFRHLLEGLLEVDDVLSDAVHRSSQAQGGRAGAAPEGITEQIGAAHRLLRRHLLTANVAPMDLEGSKAVPSMSRVVATEPRTSIPADTVLEERVAGFYLGNEVLRAADVVVAVPGPDPEPDPEHAAAAPHRRSQPRRLSRHQRRSRHRA